jgi:phosphoglycolate phosphatase
MLTALKDQYKGIRTIIWDWNGTLLNDVDVCIACMNSLLKARNKPLLDHENYLRIFTFPVREYYVKAGFDFAEEPFEIPAHQFIDLYRQKVFDSPLHDGVKEVLSYLDSKGYIQITLSAMEKRFLMQTMEGKGIIHFFRHIHGIDNHLGAGKSMAAKELMQSSGYLPSETIIIGDTLHDAEIADELGICCILVSNGHQSYERLKGHGYPVIHCLQVLLTIF